MNREFWLAANCWEIGVTIMRDWNLEGSIRFITRLDGISNTMNGIWECVSSHVVQNANYRRTYKVHRTDEVVLVTGHIELGENISRSSFIHNGSIRSLWKGYGQLHFN